MLRSLRRVAVGLYVLWLFATLLLILGRYTPFPLLPGVHGSVVAGAVVLTACGAAMLARDGYRRIAA